MHSSSSSSSSTCNSKRSNSSSSGSSSSSCSNVRAAYTVAKAKLTCSEILLGNYLARLAKGVISLYSKCTIPYCACLISFSLRGVHSFRLKALTVSRADLGTRQA